MSINIPLIANAKTVCLDLTGTSAVGVYESSNQLRGVMESMSVCNDSGSSANFTLQLNDGSNLFKIYDTFPVAAHTTLFVKDHNVQIPVGWQLEVIAGTGNALHVVAVIAEVSSVRSQ